VRHAVSGWKDPGPDDFDVIADLWTFGLAVVRESSGVLIGLALIAVFILSYFLSTIRYCSPCNRKRGRLSDSCPVCGRRMQTVYRRCS
jgi:hypothetical protein